MVSFRWTGPYQAACFRSELERILDFDYQTRRHSFTFNRNGILVYDLKNGTVSGTRWVGGDSRLRLINPGSTCEILRIATVVGTISADTLQIEISAAGTTKTYAIEFGFHDQRQWVVLAGRTGQTIFVDSQAEVDSFFFKLRLAGVNAN